jgi:aminoglycoside phosphotransferase (APT) family kinase protein
MVTLGNGPFIDGLKEKVPINDLTELATALAKFLIAFHKIDATGGPAPGLHVSV